MGITKSSTQRRPRKAVRDKGLEQFLPTSVQKSYFMLMQSAMSSITLLRNICQVGLNPFSSEVKTCIDSFMPSDPVHQFNPSACQADFTYMMTPVAIEIQDTGKGKKAVAGDLEAVLRKIEYWHQGSIARFRISYRSTQGIEHLVEWDGKMARVL